MQKAVNISKAENDLLKRCEALFGLGKCKRKQDQSKEAVHYFKQALKLAEQHAFRTQQRDIALELTKFYEHKNSEEHLKYMTIFYQSSLLLNGGDEQMTTSKLQSLTTGRMLDGDPPDM